MQGFVTSASTVVPVTREQWIDSIVLSECAIDRDEAHLAVLIPTAMRCGRIFNATNRAGMDPL